MAGARTRWSDAFRDAALAVRLLRRRPAFAVVALLTLALGIGAPTAMFSVVHAVLIRPLAYRDADRIVRFRIEGRGPGGPVAFDALPVSSGLEWRRHATTIAQLTLFNDSAANLMTADGPLRLSGTAATPELFDLLGASAEYGRTFSPARADAHQIVFSHRAWHELFQARQDLIGSSVVLDGTPFTVLGVMPEGFKFPSAETAFWVPLDLPAGGGRGMVLPAVARLAAGATPETAAQEGRRYLDDLSGRPITQTLVVETLQAQMVGPVRRLLWVLMLSVGFLCAIATVNIALLLLTRGAAREREF